jgi:hypothetical protein
MSSPSRRLCRKLELVEHLLAAPHDGLFDHPQRASLYPEMLITTRAISKSYLPLSETVLQRAIAMADRDPVAAGVASYLPGHVAEEGGEDLAGDLAALGIERDEIERRPASPPVAALVGAQYFWALHSHPVALLGSLQVFEGYPPTVELVDELVHATGLPRAAFASMYEHAVLDVRHRDELHAALDALPLTEEHEALIGVSALHTVDLLSRALNEVYERVAPEHAAAT